jgi:hypothetical protein
MYKEINIDFLLSPLKKRPPVGKRFYFSYKLFQANDQPLMAGACKATGRASPAAKSSGKL